MVSKRRGKIMLPESYLLIPSFVLPYSRDCDTVGNGRFWWVTAIKRKGESLV